MGVLRRLFGRRRRRTDLDGGTAGAVFAQQSPVGLRKDNSEFMAVQRGIRKTEREKGAPKSKKLLRAEKDAMWLSRVRRKRFEGAA